MRCSGVRRKCIFRNVDSCNMESWLLENQGARNKASPNSKRLRCILTSHFLIHYLTLLSSHCFLGSLLPLTLIFILALIILFCKFFYFSFYLSPVHPCWVSWEIIPTLGVYGR